MPGEPWGCEVDSEDGSNVKLKKLGIGIKLLHKTKCAAMCKIKVEEMSRIRMEPSHSELDGYWKFQRYQYAVQLMR